MPRGEGLLQNTFSIKNAIMVMLVYLIICGIVPVIINRVIFGSVKTDVSAWLNLFALLITNSLFIYFVSAKYQWKIKLFSNLSLKGIFLAIGCSVLFYILLDKMIDPFIDSIFTSSALKYKRTIDQLIQFPLVNFIRVCLMAPIVEEILIRGFILESLQKNYSVILSLLISSIIFAIFHFNFAQTLSSLICGLLLGILYINTHSLLCCILAHSLYNTISYIAIIFKYK